MSEQNRKEFEYAIEIISARFSRLVMQGGIDYFTMSSENPRSEHFGEDVCFKASKTIAGDTDEVRGFRFYIGLRTEEGSRVEQIDWNLNQLTRILRRLQEHVGHDRLTNEMIEEFGRMPQ